VYGEFKALVRQIVLVTASEGDAGAGFGGASSFSLWGAVMLNVDRLGDRVEAAVKLAHETAHCRLFGLAKGGRLVENDDAERYPSPLRQDLRPMEGVAHATYVTARMAYTRRALIASGALSSAEVAAALAAVEVEERACANGLKTLDAHARFKAAGVSAFAGLRSHLDSRRSPALAS
jgi:HEXXH motif-containing protein